MPQRKPPAGPPHLQPRSVWEDAFRRELIRLRPHLENASRLLPTIVNAALKQHGLDSDPKAAAQAYHASN